MGNFHYDDAAVARGPKSQPPTTVNTHQASHSTVRSGFSSAQKTLAPPTVDDTQASRSASRSSDQKQHQSPAASTDLNNPAEKPVPPPSVDINHQPPPASQGVQLDTPSQATATPNNAQVQGHHHSETRPGSTHYDIRVVNLTVNVTPPQTPAHRSQPVRIDDALERSSRDKKAIASSRVQLFCSLIFVVELVNIAFFAYYFHDHKDYQGAAYNFGIGFLITTCLMTAITLLDMINAFCTKSEFWYMLSAIFWIFVPLWFLLIWTPFLAYYSWYWSNECPTKYPGESYCPARLIAPVWVFNLPLLVLVPFYVCFLVEAA